MARKTRNDSVTGQVKAKSAIHRKIPLPAGVSLNSKEAEILWDQFAAARASETWREFDLLLLHKMVLLELDIRKHTATLDASSIIIKNQRGTEVMNPLMTVIDQLTRRQLAVIKTLSLGTHHDQAKYSNRSGTKASEKAEFEQLKVARKNGKVVSLLAGVE